MTMKVSGIRVSIIVITVALVSVNAKPCARTTQAQMTKLSSELRNALGPYYKVWIVAYWRFLSGPCDVLGSRLTRDMAKGYLKTFCSFFTKCPIVSNNQTCAVRQTLAYVRRACCKETTCKYGTAFPAAKVVGGQRAFRGEFPWVAMLLIDGRFTCGCVILDQNHALTAAHCFDRLEDDQQAIEVIAGRYLYNLSVKETGNQRVEVTSYLIHEQYNIQNMSNDIAVLTLATPLNFNTLVTPVCLPARGDKPEHLCTVAGYGYVGRRDPAEVMMKVDLATYNSSQCLKTFSNTSKPPGALSKYVSQGTLCAANGLLGGKDACAGDSGGPLMCIKPSPDVPRYYLFGIVSNGDACGKPGEPGLYTNVVHYLDWIDSKLKF